MSRHSVSTEDLTTVLSSRDLSIGYTKSLAPPLAEQINLDLKKGQLTCLLGANGVGKSTLIQTFLGEVPPLQGQVLLQGQDVRQVPIERLSRQLAVVLTGRHAAANLKVEELVALGRIPHTGWTGRLRSVDLEAIDKALADTGVAYLRGRLVQELSDGQRQKVFIARALAQETELLILDEPTAHLDLPNRYLIMQLLREVAHSHQKAILVVTHDLDIAIETADVFWLMRCGSPLLSGSPEDLILTGALASLFEGSPLYFDRLQGSMRFQAFTASEGISGDAVAVKWLSQALAKADILLPSQFRLIVKDGPFRAHLQEGASSKILAVYTSISEVREDFRQRFR
ncbi:MAG: ABC transporter ATP-binding protein [Nitritalea sp.]